MKYNGRTKRAGTLPNLPHVAGADHSQSDSDYTDSESETDTGGEEEEDEGEGRWVSASPDLDSMVRNVTSSPNLVAIRVPAETPSVQEYLSARRLSESHDIGSLASLLQNLPKHRPSLSQSAVGNSSAAAASVVECGVSE